MSLVVVLFAAPLSYATIAIRILPPFTGATASISNSTSATGCANATLPVLPAADLRTGDVFASAHAGGRGCSSQASAATSAVNVGFFGPPVALGLSGSYHVSFHWSATWTASESVTGAMSSSSAADVSVVVYAYLYDSTTGIYVGSTSSERSLVNTGTFDRGHWTGNGTGPILPLDFTAILTAGDVYNIDTWVAVDVYIVAAFGSISLASFDMGSTGNGAVLSAVTIA